LRRNRIVSRGAKKRSPPAPAAATVEPESSPHRQADLTVFGEFEGDELVCTLHGWRFDLATGDCLTAEGHPIRIRRA
jgi:UDP-MurNAc hydroxylase